MVVCHCRFYKSYRRFTNRKHKLIPVFGFGRRDRNQQNNTRHWLSGKSHLSSTNKISGVLTVNQSNLQNTNLSGNAVTKGLTNCSTKNSNQLNPRFQRHLAMNLENDMYYTIDFSDSQNSPLIH